MQFCCCNLSPRGDGNHAKRNSIPLQPLQFIPARGRKLSSHSLFSFRIQVAIYPREGTETFFTENMYRLDGCGCNLSPRGDGNIKNYSKQHIRFGCNLSPRGDGNAKMVPLTIKQLKLQFIPARGRKQNGFCRAHGIRSCNLSPRGDGNSIRPRDVHGYAMLQFIPARGRKPTHQHHWFCRHPPVAIYPREGTETCSHQRARSIPDCCNLSPRGGGNGHGGLIGCIGHRCNLSPRGDGNVERQRFSHDFRVAIYPREGTETSVVSWTYTAFWVAIYPREGTETFPCWLISCWKWLQFIPARGRKLRHYFSCDN